MEKRTKISAIVLTLLIFIYNIYHIVNGYKFDFVSTIISLVLLAIILFYNNEFIALTLSIYGITYYVDGYNVITIISTISIIMISLLLCIFICISLMNKTNIKNTNEDSNQIKKDLITLKKQIQLLQTNNPQTPATEQQSYATNNLS